VVAIDIDIERVTAQSHDEDFPEWIEYWCHMEFTFDGEAND